jgi:protein-S-isoprenylcysteine O-methyltransferase Ste14
VSASRDAEGCLPERSRLSRGARLAGIGLLFLFVHAAIPWGLSRFGVHYGWLNQRPGPWNLLALVLVITGIVGAFWTMTQHYQASPATFVALKPGEALITPGPYAYSRNPMYLAELTLWLGWALFFGSIAVLLGFGAWLAVFSLLAVPYEERDLEARFGEAYRQYKRHVPRWLGRHRS